MGRVPSPLNRCGLLRSMGRQLWALVLGRMLARYSSIIFHFLEFEFVIHLNILEIQLNLQNL
jgi:fatty acid desaturase